MFNFKMQTNVWPSLKDKRNQSVVLATKNGYELKPNSVVVLHYDQDFTGAERARVLSTLDPTKDCVYYVPADSDLGRQFLRQFNLPLGSYLLHTNCWGTNVHHMFFTRPTVSELDYLSLNAVSAAISNR